MLAWIDRRLAGWHVWAINGATLAWFIGMWIATLRALPDTRLHFCPIGLCLGGYPPRIARDTLTAIGPEGRRFLLEVLMPLDRVLPALLLVALVLTYLWYTRPTGPLPLSPTARGFLLLLPVSYVVTDYAENATVIDMLRQHPGFPDALARRASDWTEAKSQLVTAALLVAAALIAAAWWKQRQR
jgi:hypothetical protein